MIHPSPSGTRRPPLAERWMIVVAGSSYSTEAVLVMGITLMALTYGPSATAVALVAQALPRALLLPWGGTLVDRIGPTIVLRRAAMVRVAVLVVLAATAAVGGVPSLAVLVAIGALLGVIDGAAYPAAFATPPAVVAPERLARVNAVVGGTESVGDLLGPAAAAVIYAWAGPGPLLWVVVALATTSAIAAWGLHRAAPQAPPAGEARPRFVDGLRTARADREVWRQLVTIAALSLLIAGPVMVGGAVLAEQNLGGAERLGPLLGAFGAGALIGLIGAPALSRRSPHLALGGGGLVHRGRDDRPRSGRTLPRRRVRGRSDGGGLQRTHGRGDDLATGAHP